jgi:hypothetical protein
MADDENTIVRDPNDWLLEFLVDLADKKVELLITLQIGGMLVSGILASGEAYFDAVGSQLSDAKAPEDMKRAMSQLEDLYRKEPNAERDPAITVIHLKEARVRFSEIEAVPAMNFFISSYRFSSPEDAYVAGKQNAETWVDQQL